ncbi:MAG: sigma-E processing peptidase SpoIIGA, partial [Oscillospiraceae bacterium]
MINIYVDVLIVINFIVDYLLLVCLNKVSGRRSINWRTILSACVGAFSSLVIFFPQLNIISQLLFKLAISFVMVAILNKPISKSQFFKEFGLFYVITMFFGGIVFGIYTIFSPQNLVMTNG